ncbi:MAG: VWA domain-containing protein [Chitinivibrionales bacterium]|nr:VWA domain-containing protein [Chitinivibrionales bacterium]
MRLAQPLFLLLFISFIPMIWLYVKREKGLRPSVRFSDLSLFHAIPHSKTVMMRHCVFILRLIGLALLIISLARPQKGMTEQEVTSLGVDIMLVLDVSTSMKALDFRPNNRLFVAKETIKKFIAKRNHDRIGLVIFSARSFTKCPLTLDYSILTQFLDDITFGQIEDGTAIGTAIATAANRLRQSTAKSKIIILLTDGANNRGEIMPLVAAKAAAELGLKIYTIGVGKKGEVPYPVDYMDPFSGQVRQQIQMIESDVDENTLMSIAQQTKGAFFRAQNTQELEKIYNIIDTMEKSEIKTKTYTTYTEQFFLWLIAGTIVLLLELVLKQTRFRIIP